MKTFTFLQAGLGILAWVLLGVAVPGAVPQTIPFQGRVLVAGVPFHGTGQFKFALVNADGPQTYWLNSDDTSPADGVPDAAVNLDVVKGLYSVLLGDVSLPNMAGNLNPNTLTAGNVRLRVWFNNGTHGFQQLAPDQPLGSVPYALVAARVADNPVFMGNVGIGIDLPSAPLDVAGRINAASISLGGFSALDMPGSANVFVGNAGNTSSTAFNSTGLGWGSLATLTVGFNNTAVGAYSLPSTTSGGQNTALGVASLYENTEGTGNTAIGHDALHDNTTGTGNIALGWDAGRYLTTGNDNIAIGNFGVAGESGTIRIGTPGWHHTTHLAGTVKAERFEGDGGGLTNVPGTLHNTTNVVAWGGGWNGQTTIPSGLSGAKAVAAGLFHSLALKDDGTVVAWGVEEPDDDFGQADVPQGLNTVVSIAAGPYRSVALKSDGTVVSWGNRPEVPVGLSAVVAIAAGGYHTLALKQDGSVLGWGGPNLYGETSIPEGLTEVIAIAAGENHSVALRSDGTVVAWGMGDYGQTSVPSGLSGVTAIAAGAFHTIALKQDGTVIAWGAQDIPPIILDYGQATVPEGLSGVTRVAAGFFHSVALKEDGTVVAWGVDTGGNDYGQTAVPQGLTGVSGIAAGGFHTVVIRQVPAVHTDLIVSGTVSAQAFLITSDRNAKQQLTPVDPQSVLTKVAQLPVSEWSFKSAPSTRHIGPMAQDFHAAFGLGPDNRHIATVDADGVALAAIQALYARVLTLERQLEALTTPFASQPVDSLKPAAKTKNSE